MIGIIDKLKEQKFNYWKIGVLAVFSIYFLNIVFHPAEWNFLNNVNLLTHEAGHFIFMIFGNRFLVIAGGTITQIAMPLAFAFYFYLTRQNFSGALTMFWLGQNFINVSVYAGDAVARVLPLLGGDIDGHDWYNMLGMLELLPRTDFIAAVIRNIGIIIIFAAIFFGLLSSRKEPERVNYY